MACLSFFSRSPGGAGVVRQAAWRPAGRRWLRGPRSVLRAAVVVAVASGCETIAPEVQDPAIVTVGNSFQLIGGSGPGPHVWYIATIPHIFINRTESNVYFDVGCGSRHIDIEMDESGEWVPFWDPARCLIGSGFDVVEPGELYQDTLFFGGCTSGGKCGPHLTLPAASTRFRIVWEAFSSVGRNGNGDPIPGNPIPLEERVSNHFTFEVVEASH